MTYLLETCKFQNSPFSYKLDLIESNLRKQIYQLQLKNIQKNSKEEASKLLKQSENQLNEIKGNIKGINWYAFFVGAALFHTGRIFSTKVLLNEMGTKAFTHIAIASAVGLVFGGIVGYSTASNFTLYRKWNSAQRSLLATKEFIK